MKHLTPILAFLALLFSHAPAFACSCMLPKPAEESLAEAYAVVLTEIVSVEEFSEPISAGGLEAIDGGGTLMTLAPLGGGPIREIVTHRVLRSWKGPHREGELITTTTPLECCVCGMSVRRYERPPFADNMERLIARNWLVYLYGGQPYRMSVCSRTAPATSRQAADDISIFDGIIFDVPVQ